MNNDSQPSQNLRKTPRAQWIDYDCGLFFITICTYNRIHYFGKIHNGEMNLSHIGEIATTELSHPELHHPVIEIPLFCVMPNHIHAIIAIKENTKDHNVITQRNLIPSLRGNSDMARHVPTLSKYIASFKSAVTRLARQENPSFKWQARYHDHRIRNTREVNNISDYIINNPLRWESDCFHPSHPQSAE